MSRPVATWTQWRLGKTGLGGSAAGAGRGASRLDYGEGLLQRDFLDLGRRRRGLALRERDLGARRLLHRRRRLSRARRQIEHFRDRRRGRPREDPLRTRRRSRRRLGRGGLARIVLAARHAAFGAHDRGAERFAGRLEPGVGGAHRTARGGRRHERGKRGIVAADLRRLRENAEVGGGRLLRTGQPRHVAQVRRHPPRQAIGEHGLGDRDRFLGLAKDRQRKGARAVGGEVAPLQQRQERRFGGALVAGDRLAQRQPARHQRVLAERQEQLVLPLGVRVVADQVVSEAALGGMEAHRLAGLLGLGEQPQRLDGLLPADHDGRETGLDPPVARRERFGAAEEALGGIDVVERDRSLPGVDQRGQRARILREPAHRVVEPQRGRVG